MNAKTFPTLCLIPLLLSLQSGTLSAQVADDDALLEALASTGAIRAAFLGANPVQIQIDSETGEIGGPAADVAREIGRRLDTEVSIQPLAGVPAVIEAVSNGSADIGFIAYDTTRAQRVSFTQAYIYGHNSYIVRSDSGLQTFTDVDRDGARIAAISGNAVDLHLARTLENAELVHLARGTQDEEAARMVLAGEIDAYAANKQRLAAVVAVEPRVRVLDGSVLPVEQSIVVAHENADFLPRLDQLIEDLRTAGVLQEIVNRYRIAGVEVAPGGRR
jgi:polar amino acid transport system substrate-binding protein